MSRKPLVNSFFICLLIVIFTLASAAQQKPVISGRVDDSVRVTIEGSKHPLAQPQYDAGTLDPGTKFDRMLLVLGPSPEQERELQRFMESQQDKTSPDYHHWLTPEEFGQKFGPAQEDIQAVSSWLRGRGFVVTSVARSGRWLEFSGTAAQAESAFQTVLRQYDIGGSRHIANATEISIPAAIAPVVRGVVSLHNFFKKPMLTRYIQAQPNGDGTYTPINPDATFNTSTGPVHALTPGDYAKIYELNQLYTGSPALNGAGVSIAIVARSDASTFDWLDFRSLTGIPQGGGLTNTLTLPPDPGFNPNSGDAAEANLDAQWAGGVAPAAFINVVVSASTATTDGVDLSSAYIVDHNLAPVMTVSFGACESDMGAADNAFYNSLWQQAAAEGISVMVATGDSGAAGCDFSVQATAASHGLGVNGLSSTPFNTAVGGTQFQENGSTVYWSSTNTSSGVSVNGYIPEIAWNESCDPTAVNSPCASLGFYILASTGGGASGVYPKPSWQRGVFGIPSDSARDVPDVSLSAADHDGYIICFDASCEGPAPIIYIVGGTSASSPSFAGIMAIVNQAAGRQGQANYRLYELAQHASAFCNSASRTSPSVPPPSTCLFNDIIYGSNNVPGQVGFLAGTSFDLTTGLGSVNAFNLVNAWKAITLQPTTVALSSNGGASISGTHGQPVPLSITVTGGLPSPAPGGGVALMSSSTGLIDAVQVSVPASGNVATFDGTLSDLPAGNYNLIAHYSGDAQFAPADSNGIAVNITPETSSTTLGTFARNSQGVPIATTTFPYGSFMDLHADIAGASGQGVPGGSVTFADTSAAQTIGTSQVNLKGEAEFWMLGGNSFPAALTVGSHTLSASYTGDTSFNPSSTTLAVTVTKGNPTVGIATSTLNALTPGALIGLVWPTGTIQPTGTVQFFDNGVPIGTPVAIAPVTGADLNATFITQGTHPVTASYSGDANYNPAVSPVANVVVIAPWDLTLTTSTAIVAAGQSTSVGELIAPVRGSSFSGAVALTCSSPSPAITCSVNPSTANLTPSSGATILTVTINTTTAAGLHGRPSLRWPMALAGVVAIALAGFGRKSRQPLFALLALFLIAGTISCGGGGGGNPQPLPTPAPTPAPVTHNSLVITSTSGSYNASATLDVIVTH